MASGNGPSARPFNATFSSLPTTVFEKMSQLAAQHQSINLGQGFPDASLEGPASMKAESTRSQTYESNQYPPMMGVPVLRQAVADHSARHCGLPLDWATQVLITVGATEALASSFLGLLNAGDEVVLFSPLYDSYVPMLERAGAKAAIVPLRPPHWSFDQAELEAAFTPNTRLVVVNTPHNPTGKVFSPAELQAIAGLCLKHDVTAILDEVYEHLVHPPHTHTTMRSLPGMEQRCCRIGSAGKTFSFTDFKVGWLTGPPAIVAAVAKAHQFLTFTVNSALQRATAHGLTHERSFYEDLGPLLLKKRQFLEMRLTDIGFAVLPAQGTYFLVADFSPLRPLLDDAEEDDVAFCYRMTAAAGVTLIPVSAFYLNDGPRDLVRFVLCKEDEKLVAACDALQKYFDERRHRK